MCFLDKELKATFVKAYLNSQWTVAVFSLEFGAEFSWRETIFPFEIFELMSPKQYILVVRTAPLVIRDQSMRNITSSVEFMQS